MADVERITDAEVDRSLEIFENDGSDSDADIVDDAAIAEMAEIATNIALDTNQVSTTDQEDSIEHAILRMKAVASGAEQTASAAEEMVALSAQNGPDQTAAATVIQHFGDLEQDEFEDAIGEPLDQLTSSMVQNDISALAQHKTDADDSFVPSTQEVSVPDNDQSTLQQPYSQALADVATPDNESTNDELLDTQSLHNSSNGKFPCTTIFVFHFIHSPLYASLSLLSTVCRCFHCAARIAGRMC